MNVGGRWRTEVPFQPETQRSSLLLLTGLMGRAAGAHAAYLGLGLDDLAPRNLTWMLSRLLVRATRMPAAGEDLLVTTWPSGVARFLALREFLVESKQGGEIARGTSAWFLIDFAVRRPLNPSPDIGHLCVHERLFDRLERIDDSVPNDWQHGFEVGASDIDRNRHVTFSSYIRWVEEALRARGHRGGVLEFEINYLAELFEGETVRVQGAAAPSSDGFELAAVVRERDDGLAAKARVRFAGESSG
jgi:acyl-ACP thioesterase